MPTPSIDDFGSLLLEPFSCEGLRITLIDYAGGGTAGHLFKANVDEKKKAKSCKESQKVFALKLFKFDNPEINPSRRKGLRRRALHDPFYIECRANGTLVQQGLNGCITPFCHGWIKVSSSVERQAQRFNIHPLSWERPATKQTQVKRVRGILFDWVDGKKLWEVPLDSEIAAQARGRVRELHSAGIIHGDLAASNFLVSDHGLNRRLHLVDLSASIMSPHIEFSSQDFFRREEQEARSLEIGFLLLSRLPVNKGLYVTDVSRLHYSALDSPECRFIERLWAPPQPTCWHDKHSSESTAASDCTLMK